MMLLGLGSNLGDKKANLERALRMLGEHASILRVSSVYESAALLPENAPPEWDIPYYNIVCAVKTALSPEAMLGVAKRIETRLGRKDVGRWGPRMIDIDILACDEVKKNDPALTLPHPGMWARDFVVVPLAEIMPDWQHPETGVKAGDAALAFSEAKGLQRLAITLNRETRTRIVGIVNLTPDSFSDGGNLADEDRALRSMEQMLAQGADVLDIGAESTRPGAGEVNAQEEWRRLEPVLRRARAQFPHAVLSVDTRRAATAARALDAGADWINDVSGGADAKMWETIRSYNCTYVAMHSLSVPADPKVVLPEETDVTAFLRSWAKQLIERMADAGIAAERMLIDPGLGFGKTAMQSWDILKNIKNLLNLPAPLLVGHSRKSFYNVTYTSPPLERDVETHAVSAYLAERNVAYLRVHDVAGTRRTLAIRELLRKG